MSPDDQRALQDFVAYTALHPNLSRANDAALAAIMGGNNGCQVVIITGPTGVGKTRLTTGLRRTLKDHYADEAKQNPGQIPVLYGNAVSAQGSSFSWKDFYTRLLTRSNEPMVDKKLMLDSQQNLFRSLPLGQFKENSTADALRISVENCLRRRKVRCLIIDEAHHILMVSKKGDKHRLEFQFEAIKSLALETQTTIVLVGTYRLLDIRDLSGQLVRRSEIIHFPRYDYRDGQDRKRFGSVLAQFLKKIPVQHELSAVRDFKHFYNKSAGEVGILKDWLVRALTRYYQFEKKRPFDHTLLDEFALDNKSLSTIATEAWLGEDKLRDIPEDNLEHLYAKGPFHLADIAPIKNGGTGRKVGERRAKRDPVGGEV